MVKFTKISDAKKQAQSNKLPRLILIHGPDAGMCEIEMSNFRTILQSLHPELVPKRFSEDDILSNFAAFEEAISGASLFGGASLAILKVRSDSIGTKITQFINEIQNSPAIAGALLIIVNGLSPTAKIIQAFDKSNIAWSIRLYQPNKLEYINLIKAKAVTENIIISPEAIDKILDISAQDSDAIIAQVENLALYVGKNGSINIEDVENLCLNGREANVDEILGAVLTGKIKLALFRYSQAMQDNAAPIMILNALLRRLKLLLILRNEVENGASTSEVVKDKKYGIFWKEQESFSRQISLWPRKALESALSKAVELDKTLKSSDTPIIQILEKTLLDLAQYAKKRI